jgi:hypothetical protein
MSGSLSLFSAVPAWDSEGPGDCGSRVFIAEDDDGIGDKGSADTRTVSVRTLLEDLELGLFPSNAEVSKFLDYQLME